MMQLTKKCMVALCLAIVMQSGLFVGTSCLYSASSSSQNIFNKTVQDILNKKNGFDPAITGPLLLGYINNGASIAPLLTQNDMKTLMGVFNSATPDFMSWLLQYDPILKNVNRPIATKDYSGVPLLVMATYCNAANLVEILLRQPGINANVKNNKGDTSLQISVAHGYVIIVDLLIQHDDVDVNAMDDEGWTALHIAADIGNAAVVESLLSSKKINVNQKGKEGRTALDLAAAKGHTVVVDSLLKKNGINVNEKNILGKTALMYAVENDHRLVVDSLLKQEGVDINLQDKDGVTALHRAVIKGNKQILQALLDNDADFSIKDNASKTAFDLAKESGNASFVQLIQSAEQMRPLKHALIALKSKLSELATELDKMVLHS